MDNHARFIVIVLAKVAVGRQSRPSGRNAYSVCADHPCWSNIAGILLVRSMHSGSAGIQIFREIAKHFHRKKRRSPPGACKGIARGITAFFKVRGNHEQAVVV